MTWTDQHGRPVPVEQVFAAHLVQVKQRLGDVGSQLDQRRRRRRADEDTSELRVRTAAGTHIYAEQDPT